MGKSHLESRFLTVLQSLAPDLYDMVEVEYKIPKPAVTGKRKSSWRVDFWFTHGAKRCAVEIEGGVWGNGRHTRGKGYIADCTKYNYITARLGVPVLRYTGTHLTDEPQTMIDDIRAILGALPKEDIQP